MPGYLDRYGEGHEQRAKRTRRLVAAILTVLIVALGLYLGLRNHRQKSKVRDFVELLQKREYVTAYGLWGCTEAKPCPDYVFVKFMEDWGPQSRYAQIPAFRIAGSRACGSGVIVTLDLGQNRQEKLWVEGSDLILGFSPWSVCPAR